ncbi:MAG TPA: hypothetical protein VGC15_20240 [Acetobacteraceae bacterium]
MDRLIVYPGSIPLDTDLLSVQRHAMTALGALAQAVLGTQPVADGLACMPAASGYGVVVGPGTLLGVAAADATPFGSLGADPAPLVQAGVNRDPVALTLGGPPDGDHALCWLVQAMLDLHDTGPVALPYWDAANPAVPWSGPGNGGQAQNTQRVVRIALQAKAGAPQVQVDPQPPAADPGWVGLWTVMTYFGRPQTTQTDIRALPGGALLQWRLPQLSPGFCRQEAFGTNTLWRVPDGVVRTRVRVVGGGGGGGGGDTDYAGGGGGAGGYGEAVIPVQPGAVIPLQVGQGGVGGAPRVNGQQGGASWFGALGAGPVGADGGLGGHSGNPGSAGGDGGAGLAGTMQMAGGSGADGALMAGVPGGCGGGGVFGGGGRSGLGGGGQNNGRNAGAGAGGGYGAGAPGGSGAPGIVVVEY